MRLGRGWGIVFLNLWREAWEEEEEEVLGQREGCIFGFKKKAGGVD